LPRAACARLVRLRRSSCNSSPRISFGIWTRSSASGSRPSRLKTTFALDDGTTMFEYFPNNYPWSLAVMSALNRGGQISEVDEAGGSLREIAARKNDQAAQDAWLQSWMKLAERVERLGDIDAQAGHPLSAGRKYMRAGLYYLLAERMPSHK